MMPRWWLNSGKSAASKERLDLLLLFTYVDSKGTSEEGWTGWKESLILQLHRTTREYLKDGGEFIAETGSSLGGRAEMREQVDAKLGDGIRTGDRGAFLRNATALLQFPVVQDVVVSHIKHIPKILSEAFS